MKALRWTSAGKQQKGRRLPFTEDDGGPYRPGAAGGAPNGAPGPGQISAKYGHPLKVLEGSRLDALHPVQRRSTACWTDSKRLLQDLHGTEPRLPSAIPNEGRI